MLCCPKLKFWNIGTVGQKFYFFLNFLPGGGATRMARGVIRLVHGLTKSTLITYYSGMKKDPKYAFLHAFFLICLSCSSQNLSIWPKNTPFFPVLHIFTPLNDVHAYSAWSWKTTLIMWIFGRAWYPLDIWVAPPGTFCFFKATKFTKCASIFHHFSQRTPNLNKIGCFPKNIFFF